MKRIANEKGSKWTLVMHMQRLNAKSIKMQRPKRYSLPVAAKRQVSKRYSLPVAAKRQVNLWWNSRLWTTSAVGPRGFVS